MNHPLVTTVDTTVPAELEQALLDEFKAMNGAAKPDGLLRSELLRGQGGAWRIQSTWRDREALLAVRNSGEPPPALALLDRLGVEHSHTFFTVEQSYGA
jgi:heme-degrading monooxygenase HmoA